MFMTFIWREMCLKILNEPSFFFYVKKREDLYYSFLIIFLDQKSETQITPSECSRKVCEISCFGNV